MRSRGRQYSPDGRGCACYRARKGWVVGARASELSARGASSPGALCLTQPMGVPCRYRSAHATRNVRMSLQDLWRLRLVPTMATPAGPSAHSAGPGSVCVRLAPARLWQPIPGVHPADPARLEACFLGLAADGTHPCTRPRRWRPGEHGAGPDGCHADGLWPRQVRRCWSASSRPTSWPRRPVPIVALAPLPGHLVRFRWALEGALVCALTVLLRSSTPSIGISSGQARPTRAHALVANQPVADVRQAGGAAALFFWPGSRSR